jgi:hypothetical protein
MQIENYTQKVFSLVWLGLKKGSLEMIKMK